MELMDQLLNDSVGIVSESTHHGITLAMWNFEFVRQPFVITSFAFSLLIFKIIYEHVQFVAKRVPESCILILLGAIIGALMLFEKSESSLDILSYHENSFFLYLLPPIILESAYSLRDKAFVRLISRVLVFAVLGTILNVFLLAPLLYAAHYTGAMGSLPGLTFLDCLVFGSLIAAVDPVAVLAIFQEVGVNKALYFMVFGEALLNDAVTIVVYRVVLAFRSLDVIYASDIGMGIAAFFCVSFGAIAIGLFMGVLTAVITKYTDKLRILEPAILYVMGYLAYLLAEMVEFSGIISMICCVFLQCQYAVENIAPKSFLTVTYFAKAASNITESIIFIIVGVMVLQSNCWNAWHTGFVLWSVILMLAIRFAIVFLLTFLLDMNKPLQKRIKWQEQFLIAFGGLRGAISFSLAFTLRKEDWIYKDLLLATTFIIIFMTIFIQGTAIKPLVKLLSISGELAETDLFTDMYKWVVNHTVEGVEVIMGDYGHYFINDIMHYINRVVVRKYLQKNNRPAGTGFLMKYQTVALKFRLSQMELRDGKMVNSSTVGLHPAYSNMDLKLLDQSFFPSTYAETFMDAQQFTRSSSFASTNAHKLSVDDQKIQNDKFRAAIRSTLAPNYYRRSDGLIDHMSASTQSIVDMLQKRKLSFSGVPGIRKNSSHSNMASYSRQSSLHPTVDRVHSHHYNQHHGHHSHHHSSGTMRRSVSSSHVQTFADDHRDDGDQSIPIDETGDEIVEPRKAVFLLFDEARSEAPIVDVVAAPRSPELRKTLGAHELENANYSCTSSELDTSDDDDVLHSKLEDIAEEHEITDESSNSLYHISKMKNGVLIKKKLPLPSLSEAEQEVKEHCMS